MTDKTDSPSEPLLGQGSAADLPIDYDDALAHKARILMTPHAVRARANLLLDKALGGELSHVAVDVRALDPLSESLAALIRTKWPDQVLPFHSVWRRFEAGGHDRFAGLAASRKWRDVREMGRAAFDMALVAGFIGTVAPAGWGFADGMAAERYPGADGLAVASLSMIASGLFSGKPLDPLRADAGQLVRVSVDEIAAGLQIGPGKPAMDCTPLAHILQHLGEAVGLRDDLFAHNDDPRPGGLFDLLFEEGLEGAVGASRVMDLLCEGLSMVQVEGPALGGIPLGDTAKHPALRGEGVEEGTETFMPFHARLQRLVPDLVEPLVWAGVEITGLEDLTVGSDAAAVELLLDAGVVTLCDGPLQGGVIALDAPQAVELRAVTVALFDRLAEKLRMQLETNAEEMPLAGLLEGAIRYAAGKIALEKRGSLAPMIQFGAPDGLK
ncbi:DUF1688 family protein [Breoghania sp.]|uniref:DUF1688 family protein n=1 Tax=Breoghania sp. TaxID=2065378 RepID=UPI0029C9EA64|nr:DUF1688 family protein [Breoghania sp.]